MLTVIYLLFSQSSCLLFRGRGQKVLAIPHASLRAFFEAPPAKNSHCGLFNAIADAPDFEPVRMQVASLGASVVSGGSI